MPHPSQTLASKIAAERDSALAEITALRVDLQRAQARISHANVVIGSLIPRLGLPQKISEQTRGLDALDALDLIAKRGGEFRPAVEATPPEPPSLEETERIKRAVPVHSYMS